MKGIRSYTRLLPPEVRKQAVMARIELELKGAILARHAAELAGAALPPPDEDCELCGIAQACGTLVWCGCVKRKI